LVEMYARSGKYLEARRLFDLMRNRDELTYTSMIAGYGMQGEGRGALKLFEEMNKFQIKPDDVTMVVVLSAYSHCGLVFEGEMVFKEMYSVYDFNKYLLIWYSPVEMYARSGKYLEVRSLFDLMRNRDELTYTSMIAGYGMQGEGRGALKLFEEMNKFQIKPDDVTMVVVLSAYSHCRLVFEGEMVFKEMHSVYDCYITMREDFNKYLLIWYSLVEMYARSGKYLEARRLFDLMRNRDELTYTSMIAGYGMQGEGRGALKLFEEMNKFQIKPDDVTMVVVLSAYSHCGLVFEGEMVFKEMYSVYGIIPRLERFDCMVDLYGRAGFLSKAKEIISRMPYRPSTALWATLLGDCWIGNTEVGILAAEKLLEMGPENSGYYVLIAYLYATAGCWDKLAKARIFIRD
ncbi:LOW QUALITY PROTEIN: PPR domain-containing protein/PPR_2 domain-containing protein, partial [Cephalotus follicularis]